METMRSTKDKYCKFSKERFSLIVYEEYADYVGYREDTLHSSPTKSPAKSRVCTSTPSDHKKSFFDILHNINL